MGKNLVFMPECHSTNNIASELCQQSEVPDGTLVIADKQTSGRGQRGNSWESQPGMNLTFSLILKPTFLMAKNQFLLSITTSLAIYDYLTQTCSESIRIKWPNDILVNEFKICGILIENQLLGHQLTNSIVGIGFNVNQQQFSSEGATSLSLETGKTYYLQEVLDGLTSSLEVRYLQLRQNKLHDLKAAYLTHLYRFNEQHLFRSGADQFMGEISGVDEQGRLRILVQGKEKIFGVKEIAFVD
jgi:BirA family biotin operon repressor/biotin-[acetyl-CoA-carboxylase] ligase